MFDPGEERARARPGDAILLSGSIGEHGMAILGQRENLAFDAPIVSATRLTRQPKPKARRAPEKK